MIKDITDVFNNFKIRDQDPLEFAAYKVGFGLFRQSYHAHELIFNMWEQFMDFVKVFFYSLYYAHNRSDSL